MKNSNNTQVNNSNARLNLEKLLNNSGWIVDKNGNCHSKTK